MTRHDDIAPDNVHRHVLELLGRHVGPGSAGGVHLDLACGSGTIAEHVRDELGLTYVGIDHDPQALAALGSRGFETHRIDIADGLATDLVDVVAGRRLVSVTWLDGLAHLAAGSPALRALSALVEQHRALLVASVPNVTHLDVAVEALLGRSARTPHGFWSAPSLQAAFDAADLDVVDRYDVETEPSEHHLSADHVALSPATSLGAWLASLRRGAAPHGSTRRFVWAARTAGGAPTIATSADPSADHADAPDAPDAAQDPVLSFIVRAHADRSESLDETLLSLAAQTSTDFEVMVVAPTDSMHVLRHRLAEHPATLRDRVALVPADGTTAAMLNAGVAAARGSYVCLSDDITWFAQWVESVQQHSGRFPGRCVRGLVLEQEVDLVEVGGETGIRATAAPVRDAATRFSLRGHVTRPLASTHGVAFPRSLATQLGVTFEESFGTSSVRRHVLRAVELAGVTEVGQIVALHRRLTGEQQLDADQDLIRLVEAVDSLPWLAPAGSASAAGAPDAVLEEALRTTREELAHVNELVRLKDDHIHNLEALLERREASIGQLQARVDKHKAQVERLRQRLSRVQPAVSADEGAPDATDDDPAQRHRWLRRQR